MKKFSILAAFIGLASLSFGQMTMADPDYDQNNFLDCAGIVTGSTNFIEASGNYLPNTADTLVLCPDLSQGSKVSVAFATNIGFEWNVDASDTLYIFDGPDVNAPLIGAYNSGTDPMGFNVQASWNNPSGCLTLVFVSDGAVEGTGWVGNIACGDAPQPFTPHIEAFVNGQGPNALNPLDTGYVDICFGDSILFVAKPDFPNAFEVNGFGYSQNINNCNYNWTIGGIGQFTNDSIWFTPPARSGYFIDLRITDQFPLIERVTCKVRVSQLPSFAGTGPLEDTVCVGENTVLLGGVTQTDTVGIDIPEGQFEIGGIFAGLTALPDGAGLQYTTDIGITGFGSGNNITSGSDIDQICLDIEHSWLGDLEISLTCPNGTTVSLVDAYSGGIGMLPGGCAGGGTFLGNDTGIDGGAPGSPVWTYCFSAANATLGTMCAENTAGNTLVNDYGNNAMTTNGVYLPDGNFDAFIGCPIDGNWTITVQDNQGIDDGYIFQWGIYFNSSLYPNSEGYQNYVTNEFWHNDPTIVSDQSDTLIVVQPSQPGTYNYTFEVTDDFGCTYDTTVAFEVLPLPSIQSDTLGCNLGVQLQGTFSYNGGVWSAADTSVHFQPDEFAENPLVYTTVPGTYTLIYTDVACNTSDTMQVEFPPYVYAYAPDTTLCNGVEYELTPTVDPSVTSFQWNTGDVGPTITITQEGYYVLTVANQCHSGTDTVFVDYKLCDIVPPNVISLSSTSGNNTWHLVQDGIKDFNCTIVNRWGNVIYEFDNPAGSWDGTSKGEKVSEGTYYYIINAVTEGGEEIKKHGFIQVIH